ncbi:hypothetical protein SCARD494_07520 [Seiridium cardinale]
MEAIRARLLRQAEVSNGRETSLQTRSASEMEQGRHQGQEQEQDGRRRFILRRPRLPSLLSGQSRGVGRLQRRNTDQGDEDGPKTPRFHLGLPSLPSARLHLPNVSRTTTRDGSSPPPPRGGLPPMSEETQPRASLQRSLTDRGTVVVEPEPTHARTESNGSRSRRSFRGADPAEMHLADLAESGRRRRHRARANQSEQGGKPKRFLYCFPWIKSRRIRSQILRCFVSGMFLLLMLAIYLALSVTKNINNSEFTILLILIILFTTIFFCHGLIRLCMLIVRPKSAEDEERARLPEMLGPGGYAVPRRPIRVLLARDEEAAGVESETTKLQPPAYGLWRESVRVDPNRIYWQRNDVTPTPGQDTASRPATANRPPSYASDDGVEYVVEARPRSTAPLADMQLPTHPSEMGRAGQLPTF